MLTRRDLLGSFALTPALLRAARSARLRTSLCAYSFRGALGDGSMQYEDLVDLALENEIDGLDLTVYWFPRQDRDDFLSNLRRKAYMNAVEIPSIAIRSDLCQPEERDREKEAAWLMHWVDVADRLGAGFIRVFGGNVPKGNTEEEAVEWCKDVLAQAADYAASRAVILGIENHGGITLNADRIIQIVEGVDHPAVRVNLDTGNFRSRPYEQIAELIPYAANSQFKVEMHLDGGGNEDSDWDRIVKMMADGGYRGYMALEYEASEDPAVAVPRHLKTLNALKEKYG